MRTLLLLPFFFFPLFALDVGSAIGPQLQQRLELNASKIAIIDVFASWCHNCKEEMPMLIALHKRLDPARVEMIGVDVDRRREKGEAFVKSQGIDFRVIYDPTYQIVRAFGVKGVPSLLIIKDGIIRHLIVGAKEGIDRRVESHLKALQ